MIVGTLEKGVLMLIPFCPIGLGGSRYLIAVAVWPKYHVPYASAGHVNCSSLCTELKTVRLNRMFMDILCKNNLIQSYILIYELFGEHD
jgi:hypothetical protein